MVRENNDPCIGIGGAPTRCSTLPTDAAERKKYPIATGFLDYFPDAIAAIANVSWQGNEQHNPGQPLHWARSKSPDEADTMQRHFSQRGTLDTDGKRHTAKAAWRLLAILQKEIEGEKVAVEGKEPCKHPGGRYCPYCDGGVPKEDVKVVLDDHHENFMPANPIGLGLVCASRSSGGSKCVRPTGHRGDHMSGIGLGWPSASRP